MSRARPATSDALLRLGALAAVTMAGLHGWLAWGMRDWPTGGPAPQPLPAAAIAEFMLWFLLVPAAIVVALRWRTTRDRWLGLASMLCIALTAWSLFAWDAAYEDGAALAGEVLRLHLADAGLSLLGAVVAIRALRQRRFTG